jgi:DNA-binding protein H-NS
LTCDGKYIYKLGAPEGSLGCIAGLAGGIDPSGPLSIRKRHGIGRPEVSIETVDNMSLEEIRQRLQTLDNDRSVLEGAFELKRQQTKKEVAEEIREMIQSRGYEIREVLDIIESRRRAGSRGKVRGYLRYVDPEDPHNAYTRGVLPGWMKQKMAAHGLDAKSRKDREAFKKQYLQRQDP